MFFGPWIEDRKSSVTMRSMNRLVRVAAIALLTLGIFVSAADAETAPRKFGRGLAGMTLSILEVPGNMVDQTRKRGAAEGVPLGFAIGLGMIVPRTLVGVYEFVTAPFPIPAGYQPILHPEFPWSYFQ